MQVMSVTRADSYTTELENTKDRQSETISDSNMIWNQTTSRKVLEFLRKCQHKFDCLIFEMFFIKDLKPTLNKQSDSIRAKLFV